MVQPDANFLQPRSHIYSGYFRIILTWVSSTHTCNKFINVRKFGSFCVYGITCLDRILWKNVFWEKLLRLICSGTSNVFCNLLCWKATLKIVYINITLNLKNIFNSFLSNFYYQGIYIIQLQRYIFYSICLIKLILITYLITIFYFKLC